MRKIMMWVLAFAALLPVSLLQAAQIPVARLSR